MKKNRKNFIPIFSNYISKKFQDAGCKNTINIITDWKKSITNAISKNCPNWNLFFCWNHLLKDATNFFIKNDRISLKSGMHCFAVQGLNLQFHAEQFIVSARKMLLFCQKIAHTSKLVNYLRAKTFRPKVLQFQRTQKNLQGRNRSKRKRHRVNETKNLEVKQAPDSKAKHVINSSDNHLSFNSNFRSKRMRLTEGVCL